MNHDRIKQSLHHLFFEDNHRLVFWYDAEQAFQEELGGFSFDGISLLRLDQEGALKVKLLLETEDTVGKYLVYTPMAEPEPAEDWLYDIKAYSKVFHADRSSIIIDDLNLTSPSLRLFIAKYQAFFNNKQRVEKLKRWLETNDDEDQLSLKMTAVLLGADQPEEFSFVLALMDRFAGSFEGDPSFVPKEIKDCETYGLLDFFWHLMAKKFNYEAENPTVYELCQNLMVTEFCYAFQDDNWPKALEHLILKGRHNNITIFLDQWRKNIQAAESFRTLSNHVAERIELEKHLQKYTFHQLLNHKTFLFTERHILRAIRDQVFAGTTAQEFMTIRELVEQRKTSFWCWTDLAQSIGSNPFAVAYQALLDAIELNLLKLEYPDGFTADSTHAFLTEYTTRIYRFDQIYRHFMSTADLIEQENWDVLKELRSAIEQLYSEWFLPALAKDWGNLLRKDNMLEHWTIPGVTNQYRFYDSTVKSQLDGSQQARAYVIISDAFRYEVAQELVEVINSTNRMKAEIKPMLSVLPSYTRLGMAALLPHKELSYKDDGTIFVDGISSSDLKHRSEILGKKSGIAVSTDELVAMSKQDGRDFVRPHRVIYLYHNHIDSIGDDRKSEDRTFKAVTETINHLSSVVKYLLNNLNASRVFLTADHGFLFRESKMADLDRQELAYKPSDCIETNKRFLIGRNLPKNDQVICGSTAVTAKTSDDVRFWLPFGTAKFHFQGGSRFVHGGAMPQEVIIPLITVKQLSGEAADRSKVRSVDISPLGRIDKMVNRNQKFTFIQNEAVGERLKPRTVLISIRCDGELISNEERLVFDSESSSLDDRQQTVMLRLKQTTALDRSKSHSLIIRDAETNVELERYPITIDLTFDDDF